MKDWSAKVTRDLDFAKTMLMQHGSVSPMFVLHCPTETKVVGVTWDDAETKRAARTLVTVLGVAEAAEAISFISEAWTITVPKRDDESDEAYAARIEAMTPETAPERVEVLIVTTTYREDNERHTIAAVAKIERDAKGEVSGTTDIGQGEGDANQMEGPMTMLLCPYEPTEDMRESARDLMATISEGMKVERHDVH